MITNQEKPYSLQQNIINKHKKHVIKPNETRTNHKT